MKPRYAKQVVEKEYKEDKIKVTRYEMKKPKPTTRPRVYRKPTYGSK